LTSSIRIGTKFKIWNPEFGIRNPEPRTQNPEPRIQNPESGIKNSYYIKIKFYILSQVSFLMMTYFEINYFSALDIL
jgi:hypothetical protein